MDYRKLHDSLLSLTAEVGRALHEQRREIRFEEIEKKGRGDFVSRADRDAERRLRAGLLEMLPGSVVMGEEESPDASGGQWRWIVDPLDGTANYLLGLPAWAVSVALEDRRSDPDRFGPRRLGAVHVPAMDITWSAVEGEGAWRGGEPIHVQQHEEMDRTALATGFPFRRPDMLDRYLDLFRDLYTRVSDMRRIGAAAADLGWVAEGTFGGFFELDLKPWDLAAGCLIIEQAGGVATDWWGNDPLETGWVVCGSPAVHRMQREVIDEHRFSPPKRFGE